MQCARKRIEIYFREDETIMKKTLSLFLALTLILSLSSAFALGYTGSQGNASTFELLEEARVSGPAAVANLETNTTKTFVSHPALDNYPLGTTYVYRSANLYGGSRLRAPEHQPRGVCPPGV